MGIKIIKAVCKNCRCLTAEFIKKDNYGNWVRCMKCDFQTITKEIDVIFEDDNLFDRDAIYKYTNDIQGLLNLEQEKKMKLQELDKKKKLKQQKIEATRKKAINKIMEIFHHDFLSSKKVWKNEFSKWVSEDEFHEISLMFLKNWFEKEPVKTPDEDQLKSISEVWHDVQVVARAGSGKTTTTVNRAYFLVKHCKVSPSQILLLAFNNQAAEEVYKRLRSLLGNKAPQAMTFHALAYSIVHPEEELIYDEEMNGNKQSSTVQQVIDSFIRSSSWSERIKDLMMKYFRADWEEIISKGYQLNPEEMVEYRRSLPYIGLDGKYYKSKGEKFIADYLFERDIPFKYERNFWWDGQNYKPDFTIPVNHQKLLGVVIEYFGMVGNNIYDKQIGMKRRFWGSRSDYHLVELYPSDVDSEDMIEQVLFPHLRNCGILQRKLTDLEIWHRIKDRAVGEFSLIVSQFINRARQIMMSPDELVEKVNQDLHSMSELQVAFLRVVWKIYKEYLTTLSHNDEEDFNGLIIRAIYKINSGESRWKRRKDSGDLSKVQYLFIDEYQDVSYLFYRIISAIKNVNHALKVYCVGDDWQAINGFAGSDLRFFNNFNEYFSNAKQFHIPTNYRSYQNIISVGNQLMDGEGEPAKGVLDQPGEVWFANINDFIPSTIETSKYKGQTITPALIRLVYFFTKKGQRVVMLCRRRNGLPWYTPYDSRKGKFHNEFINAIRNALPQELRAMVVIMDTVHSYKGKEEDTIIMVDAVDRSFPLIHPSNVFFEILGTTMESVIAEEKRLFYVGLSRAMKSLVILTERGAESPFLKRNIQYSKYVKTLNLTKLTYPNVGGHYTIKISNNHSSHDTLKIKAYLLENKYLWNPAERIWEKGLSAKGFNKEKLLNESWIEHASNVFISVIDEFENNIFQINIKQGEIIE